MTEFFPKKKDLTLCFGTRRKYFEDGFSESRLAAASLADYSDRFSAGHVQTDVVKGMYVASIGRVMNREVLNTK
jgi:hypothetical protein